MTLDKKEIVKSSFFNAQFNYFPLIWEPHSYKNNNKMEHLQESYLRLIYSDKKSSNKNISVKDHSFSIHRKTDPSIST